MLAAAIGTGAELPSLSFVFFPGGRPRFLRGGSDGAGAGGEGNTSPMRRRRDPGVRVGQCISASVMLFTIASGGSWRKIVRTRESSQTASWGTVDGSKGLGVVEMADMGDGARGRGAYGVLVGGNKGGGGEPTEPGLDMGIGGTEIFCRTPRPEPAAAATELLVCWGPAPSTSMCMTPKAPRGEPPEAVTVTGDMATGVVGVCAGVSVVPQGLGTKSLTRKREQWPEEAVVGGMDSERLNSVRRNRWNCAAAVETGWDFGGFGGGGEVGGAVLVAMGSVGGGLCALGVHSRCCFSNFFFWGLGGEDEVASVVLDGS